MKEKDKLIETLRNEKYVKLLNDLSHVSFVKGHARFHSEGHLRVNGTIYRSNRFIIATGSSPSILPIGGIEKVQFLNNIESLQLKELPESMIVLGGRALGIEFAHIFSRFGTKVCLLQRSERILPAEEPELIHPLQQYLQEEGIEIVICGSDKDGRPIITKRCHQNELLCRVIKINEVKLQP